MAETEKALVRRPNVASRKRRFLRALSEGNSVVGASAAAGRNPRTFYRWRDEDEQFDLAWQEAEKLRCEAVAQEVYKRAFNGSDTLLIFLMKRLDPSFRDTHQVQLEHTGKVEHEHKVVSAVAVLNILQDAGAFDGFEDRPGGALAGSRELLAAHTNGEAGGVPPASSS